MKTLTQTNRRFHGLALFFSLIARRVVPNACNNTLTVRPRSIWTVVFMSHATMAAI